MQNTTTKYGLPFDSKINSEFVTYMGIALGMSPRFALVKYGGGITQMSGSIAGNTFARNRFGNYVRARTKPVNPRSTAQEKIRSVMAYLAERWHADLVASNRTAWANYAAAVAMKNKLGETIHLSGFNHFIRSNSDRLYSGESVLDGGPTVLSLPETDPTTSATYSVATNLISFSYDITMDHALEPGAYMKVYQGRPQLATRNFFNGPWRWASHWQGNVAPVSPQDFPPPLTILLGQKVWLYSRISRADGRLSTPMVINCAVTA